MEFEKGLFTLTVDPKRAVTPTEIKKAVGSYELGSISIADLVGTAAKEGDKIVFKAAGSGAELEVVAGKEPKNYEKFQANLEAKPYKLSGVLSEEKRKDSEGKEKKVLKLALASAELKAE